MPTSPASTAPFGVLAQVAEATQLGEGEAGVLRVLRALAGPDRRAAGEISRFARLPVPVASAVLGELRKLGVVDDLRPAGLTAAGRALVATLGLRPLTYAVDPWSAPLSPDLVAVAKALDALVAQQPDVDVTLDQSFATGETKVRRVLWMIAAGALPTPSLLIVGDDDLLSVAVARVGAALGLPLAGEVVVVDISAAILATIASSAPPDAAIDLIEHDLRRPLPSAARGRSCVASTDPPYTTQGAALFLARGLEGLRPGPGWDVFLHYGGKPPGPALALQTELTRLGLVVRELRPGVNHYLGAGVISGRSDAYRLELAARAGLSSGGEATAYDGPMYTADLRGRGRHYVCAGCGERFVVGPREPVATVGALQAQGCPTCDGTSFRPGSLAPQSIPGVQA